MLSSCVISLVTYVFRLSVWVTIPSSSARFAHLLLFVHVCSRQIKKPVPIVCRVTTAITESKPAIRKLAPSESRKWATCHPQHGRLSIWLWIGHLSRRHVTKTPWDSHTYLLTFSHLSPVNSILHSGYIQIRDHFGTLVHVLTARLFWFGYLGIGDKVVCSTPLNPVVESYGEIKARRNLMVLSPFFMTENISMQHIVSTNPVRGS